jgi:hypothetical protein
MVPFAGLGDGIRSTDVQEDENVVGLLEEAAFARRLLPDVVRPDQPNGGRGKSGRHNHCWTASILHH